MIPLALFPWGLGEWLEWLPFASQAWAPLALYTDSGMSIGPCMAPLTKTPGRVVAIGFCCAVRGNPCRLRSMPKVSASRW